MADDIPMDQPASNSDGTAPKGISPKPGRDYHPVGAESEVRGGSEAPDDDDDSLPEALDPAVKG